MKRISIILTALAIACVPTGVMAHDVSVVAAIGTLEAQIAELQSAVIELRASSGGESHNAEIADLKARLDAGANMWNQESSIDDLYMIVDKLTEHLSAIGKHVRGDGAVPPNAEPAE